MEEETANDQSVSKSSSDDQRASYKSVLIVVAFLTTLIAVAWVFPIVWYKRSVGEIFWLSEKAENTQWRFANVPISKEVVETLNEDVAMDQIAVGKDNLQVRAFYTKTFTAKTGAKNVFQHNPDVCWTSVGWKSVVSQPEYVSVKIANKDVLFERRCFLLHGQMILVYFGALVGGDIVPYRMNYGMALNESSGNQFTRRLGQIFDMRLWKTIYNSLSSRKSLQGPTHFIRVSVPVKPDAINRGDSILSGFLADWMVQGSFKDEFEQWKKKSQVIKP